MCGDVVQGSVALSLRPAQARPDQRRAGANWHTPQATSGTEVVQCCRSAGGGREPSKVGAEVSVGDHSHPPLGVMVPTRRQHTVRLVPGSALVLYTDGLIERAGEPIDAGLQRLTAAVDDSPAASAEHLCASLLNRCLRDLPRRDDTAVICAAIDRRTSPR
ncbi:MAG: SpoIIE family protein phosphatase [Actinomycetes bacterium]